jgi:replicative DNA helicase
LPVGLIPSAAHARHYAQIVARIATFRRLIDAAQAIAEDAYPRRRRSVVIARTSPRLFIEAIDLLKARFGRIHVRRRPSRHGVNAASAMAEEDARGPGR